MGASKLCLHITLHIPPETTSPGWYLVESMFGAVLKKRNFHMQKPTTAPDLTPK